MTTMPPYRNAAESMAALNEIMETARELRVTLCRMLIQTGRGAPHDVRQAFAAAIRATRQWNRSIPEPEPMFIGPG